MAHVLSKDGTRIVFDRIGDGPPLILVLGAFNERPTGLGLAEFLAPHFTVLNYDRRGRGESGDTLPYAVGREIEDLAALIAEAGGSASVFGYSSGAALALRGADAGLPITKLALYDPPFEVVEEPHPAVAHAAHLSELVAAGRRAEAVEYFQAKVVGIPEEVVIGMRQAPFRPALEGIAHTLVYDMQVLGDGALPIEMVRRVAAPTLVIAGGASPILKRSAEALAAVLPDSRLRILEGQNHDIVPTALGPVVREFLERQQ